MFCPQGYFSPENSTECFACPLLLASVLARFNSTGQAEWYGKVDLEGDQKVLTWYRFFSVYIFVRYFLNSVYDPNYLFMKTI